MVDISAALEGSTMQAGPSHAPAFHETDDVSECW